MTLNPKNIKPISQIELKSLPENHVVYNIYSWANQYDYVQQHFQQEIITSSFNLDISSMITSIASNLLTSMFFSSDYNPESNLMEVFAECFTKLTNFVNTVR